MNKGPLDNFGFVEIIVTGAIALGLGFWQLWSINREIAQDKERLRRRMRHLIKNPTNAIFLANPVGYRRLVGSDLRQP